MDTTNALHIIEFDKRGACTSKTVEREVLDQCEKIYHAGTVRPYQFRIRGATKTPAHLIKYLAETLTENVVVVDWPLNRESVTPFAVPFEPVQLLKHDPMIMTLTGSDEVAYRKSQLKDRFLMTVWPILLFGVVGWFLFHRNIPQLLTNPSGTTIVAGLAIILATFLFFFRDAARRSFLVPGGLYHTDAGYLGRSKSVFYETSRSVLFLRGSGFPNAPFNVFLECAAGKLSLKCTSAERIAILTVWLSALAPPSESQLEELG